MTSSDSKTEILCEPDLSRGCTKISLKSTIMDAESDNRNKEMEKIIAGYTRVSSREQAENTHALEQQTARVKDAGATHIFTDVEKGKKDARPQYQELIQLIEARRVQTLIITRIDRITRSLPTLRRLVDLLQSYDVNLIILDQKMDLSTPQGKLMLNMLGVLAEWEVDLLSERVKRGKTHQRNQRWAHGSCPFGYIVLDHQYVLDQTPYLCLLMDQPDNYQGFYSTEFDDIPIHHLPHRTVAQVARDCIETFLTERSIARSLRQIFARYGISKTRAKVNGSDRVLHWSKRGFSQWLQNPILDGHTRYGINDQTANGKRLKPKQEWEMIYNTHADHRLLKDGEADDICQTLQVNFKMGPGAFGYKNSRKEYRPYSYQIQMIYCGECNSRAIQKRACTAYREYAYYGCRHSGIGCKNSKHVKQVDIEAALIQALLDKAEKFNQNGEQQVDKEPFKTERLQKLEQQLSFLEQFPGFNPHAEQLRVELQHQIEEERNFFQSRQLQDKTVEEIIRAGSNLGVWQTLSNTEKVQIYCRIVDRIYIRNGSVESIVFKNTPSMQQENAHERH